MTSNGYSLSNNANVIDIGLDVLFLVLLVISKLHIETGHIF